jgi:hypothetical protein
MGGHAIRGGGLLGSWIAHGPYGLVRLFRSSAHISTGARSVSQHEGNAGRIIGQAH